MWTGKYCERCGKIGFEMCKCKKDQVEELTEKHADTWSDKSQLFWFWSLLEEVFELALALLGLHKDPPEFELAQIASIAINWRKRRLTMPINATVQSRLFTQD